MRYLCLIALLVGGCAHRVVRDAATYQVEVLAALERQEEAADALLKAAELARREGDRGLCEELVRPALLIEAAAQPQAYRALWLAGLPYPGAEGPPRKQPDPGPSKPLLSPADACAGEVWP